MTDRHSSAAVPVTLLDCTLRDGGYYNEWDYSPALIRSYLSAMSSTRVPIVELGFRTTETGRYMGPTAYTTDRFLDSLDLPTNLRYGVMLNAKEVVADNDAAAVVDRLFQARAKSAVELVRIAANYSELPALAAGVDRLHMLGYDVGVNLMQIASRTAEEISTFGRTAAAWGVCVAYFADSFGGMQPDHISSVVATLRDAFGGPVGCHTHDNMSLAFANSIAAIDAGASFVDATVLGMGRGPGNARTEYVAFELARRGLADLDAAQLVPLVANEFAELQREYGWGSNIYYFLSAANGIHPTYIQEMTKDGRYSVPEIVAALDELSVRGGASFNRAHLEPSTPEPALATANGSFDATNWCAGRNVLIVGPGAIGVERRRDVENFIRATQPLVIALNPVPPVNPTLVDVYALCHPVRAVIDAAEITKLEQPTFMPKALHDQLQPTSSVGSFRDYGLSVEPSTFTIRSTSCVIPRQASFPYALALAAIGGALEVLLTGFDGFEASDPRQAEMEDVFALFAAMERAPAVTAMTKTSYAIGHSSIYAT